MTSKLNIFNSLPQHASDSEEETNTKNAKTKVRHQNQEQRKHDHEKGTAHGHTAPKDPNQKEDVARQKNQQRSKGVTAEAHPNDRHSGTGKGNWGNFKEDRKAGEEGDDTETPEVQEEEKPEGITLSEYLANKRVATNEPQVNEAKSKITSEQLMKEVGKATLLKTKATSEIDDKIIGKKKEKLNVNHHAAINSEHASLLNFRTGFVEKEYKERVFGEDSNEPRRFGGAREHRERREKTDNQEGQAETQGDKAQGEKAPAQTEAGEVATPTEGKTQEQGQGQGQEQRYQKRSEGENQGGYVKGGRGGYRGDRPQGDRPHGDRPQGERRPYGDRPQGERKPYGNKQSNTKVNVEDESAFPKLG